MHTKMYLHREILRPEPARFLFYVSIPSRLYALNIRNG